MVLQRLEGARDLPSPWREEEVDMRRLRKTLVFLPQPQIRAIRGDIWLKQCWKFMNEVIVKKTLHLVALIHTENKASKTLRLMALDEFGLTCKSENVALKLVSLLWWQAAVKAWWWNNRIYILLTDLWREHHCCIWANTNRKQCSWNPGLQAERGNSG